MPKLIFLSARDRSSNDERFSLSANRSKLCAAMATVISVAKEAQDKTNTNTTNTTRCAINSTFSTTVYLTTG